MLVIYLKRLGLHDVSDIFDFCHWKLAFNYNDCDTRQI